MLLLSRQLREFGEAGRHLATLSGPRRNSEPRRVWACRGSGVVRLKRDHVQKSRSAIILHSVCEMAIGIIVPGGWLKIDVYSRPGRSPFNDEPKHKRCCVGNRPRRAGLYLPGATMTYPVGGVKMFAAMWWASKRWVGEMDEGTVSVADIAEIMWLLPHR